MSNVVVTATATKVAVEGATGGGTFNFDSDGTWTALLSEPGQPPVRIVASANRVEYYTGEGHTEFPTGWTFAIETPDISVKILGLSVTVGSRSLRVNTKGTATLTRK